ncbi:MAG: HAMP domain-containing protein [Gammaproteobacteria bacterium]|nr:HAMP domain-containing protein [Gammaproteobacteria bacterium]
MANAVVRRRRAVMLGTVGLLTLSLLGSLVLMSAAMQNSDRFGALYSVLLLSNTAGLMAFVWLIGVNVRRLLRQIRAREPGARLTLRMLVIFVALAVLPVTVLYTFSLDFLRRGIDSWFDVRVGDALQSSLELSREALDLRMRELLSQTESMAEEITQGAPPERTTLNLDALRDPGSIVTASAWTPGPSVLDAMRARSGADELTLLSADGEPLATSSRISDLIPHLPAESLLVQLRQGRSYIGLDPLRDGTLFVRVAVSVNVAPGAGAKRVLHALYPIAPRINRLAGTVENAYAKYHELDYLREKLKLSFAMTLTMVLLFSIVTAVWAAFYSARRLAAPIRDLAIGTAAVAAGDYATSLPVQSNDEMGFLVSSFNDMTRRIGRARAETETQREYLDTVLRQLSSGVVALDEAAHITTLNESARRMLELDDDAAPGLGFIETCRRDDHLHPLADTLEPLLAEQRSEWQEQITIFASNGRRVLMCRGTSLARHDSAARGYVIVFENITAIIQGQRDAAWSEVARRLAHEIKNPLTPIQLAAERLRQKYLKKLGPEEGEALERLTSTIVQQVETMKAIVNTFSDYAKSPVITRAAVDINALIAGVVDLFRGGYPEARIETRLAEGLPPLSGDPTRLRQVLNNLVKNAFEASPEPANAHIIVSTSITQYAQADHVEIRIEDRGEGLPEPLLSNIFEPYVTSKAKGTGLGLAIVKKIVEEHNGVVTLRNNPEVGAVAIIRLPLDKEPAQNEEALLKDAV